MPPKDKRVVIKPRDTAKMPRNPAEDALYRLTHAGDLFKDQVLARLDPTERGMLRLVNKDLRIAVRNSDRQPWTFKVSDFIGSVKRFKWALKNKILRQVPLTGAFVKAIIKGGNLDVLKGATTQYAPGFEFTLDDISTAAAFGKTQIFEWFMDQPALRHKHWPEPLRYAARGGQLDILKVFKARADTYPDDEVWHPKWDGVREWTFFEGNVEIFEWVLAHGTCEQDMRTFMQFQSDPRRYYNTESFVLSGHLEMLQWYMARLEVENLPDIVNNKKKNCIYVKRAAERGHLEMLKWMVENGFKFDVAALTKAAKWGHLECILYLRERGCNITPTVSKVTVNFAQIHVLRWVIENGGKWVPQWTLDQLEQIDDPHAPFVGKLHACHIKNGTVHENFGEDLQWVIQRAHQQITDDKLAAEEKQRRKDEKQRREAKKRKAN